MESIGNVFVGKRIIYVFKDNKIEKSSKANKIMHAYTEKDLKIGLENAFKNVLEKQKKSKRSLRKTTSFSRMRWIRHTCRSSESDRSSFVGNSEPSSPDNPSFKVRVDVIIKDDKMVWVKIVVIDEKNIEISINSIIYFNMIEKNVNLFIY